jgi:hypothetical protein
MTMLFKNVICQSMMRKSFPPAQRKQMETHETEHCPERIRQRLLCIIVAELGRVNLHTHGVVLQL